MILILIMQNRNTTKQNNYPNNDIIMTNNTHTYMHACIQTYIRTYIHAYRQTSPWFQWLPPCVAILLLAGTTAEVTSRTASTSKRTA